MTTRRILVTGAAQGLGLAIAKRLAAAGARLALVDVLPGILDLPESPVFDGKAVAIKKDLAELNASDYVMDEAVARLGSLNGLVNCAAWSLHGPASAMTVEKFDRLVAINQRAPFFLSQRFVEQLTDADTDPCIVNIASVNAIAGNPNLIAYSGTKGALISMTRSMAVEFAPRVRVVAVSPGSIFTPAAKELIEQGTIQPETHFSRYLIKRFITCEEIADLVAFLLGPSSGSVTGSNWTVDGGYTAQ